MGGEKPTPPEKKDQASVRPERAGSDRDEEGGILEKMQGKINWGVLDKEIPDDISKITEQVKNETFAVLKGLRESLDRVDEIKGQLEKGFTAAVRTLLSDAINKMEVRDPKAMKAKLADVSKYVAGGSYKVEGNRVVVTEVQKRTQVGGEQYESIFLTPQQPARGPVQTNLPVTIRVRPAVAMAPDAGSDRGGSRLPFGMPSIERDTPGHAVRFEGIPVGVYLEDGVPRAGMLTVGETTLYLPPDGSYVAAYQGLGPAGIYMEGSPDGSVAGYVQYERQFGPAAVAVKAKGETVLADVQGGTGGGGFVTVKLKIPPV